MRLDACRRCCLALDAFVAIRRALLGLWDAEVIRSPSGYIESGVTLREFAPVRTGRPEEEKLVRPSQLRFFGADYQRT
jgi:hypothetical protein